MISAKHQEALNLAHEGIPVFPCKVNGKQPACPNGFHDATTDETQINRWWNEADYNIGIEPARAGLCVVDLDYGGQEEWDALCSLHGSIRTATVRTPSDGRHLYFLGNLPASTKCLARHIDTRGSGSYVLVPPSFVIVQPGEKRDYPQGYSGQYAWETDCGYARLPSWVAERLVKPEAPASEAKGEPVTIDHLRKLLPFVGSPDMSRNEWRDIVAAIRNCNVPDDAEEDQRYGLALAWSRGDLTVDTPGEFTGDEAVEEVFWTMPPNENGVGYGTIYHAAKVGGYAGPSAKPIESTLDAFGPAILELVSAEAVSVLSTPDKKSRFRLIRIADLDREFQEPNWLIPNLIPENSVVQIQGKEKSFKTFLTLDLTLGIASGTQTFGHTPDARPVAYCVGENAAVFGRHHVQAWKIARQVETDFPFVTVPTVPMAIRFHEESEALLQLFRREKFEPRVVVIDTASRALRGLDENSARDMGIFSEMCDRLRLELGCSVIVIRHMGKDQTRGARGSNSLEGDFDTVLEVARFEKSMAVEVRVKEQRNALELPHPFTFEGRPVGPSLVFFPTTPAEHSLLTRTEHEFSRTRVGEALRNCTTPGIPKVPTFVLAAELRKGAGPEAIAQAVSRLKILAKAELRGYAEKTGTDFLWFMPAPSDAADEQAL